MSMLETDYHFYLKKKRTNPAQVIEVMSQILTPERQEKIRNVIEKRTLNIIPVLDGICDLGNASAVMRSAEAFGLLEMHMVENQTKYKLSKRTTKGTDKWLNVKRWMNSLECAQYLKKKGYRICSTHLDSHAVSIDEVDFTIPTALILGNEKDGVSQEILEMSDVKCIIPMQGFAQSFNISVAAALSFYHIYKDRTRRQGVHGDLTPEQKEYLIADYFLRSVDNAEIYFG